MKCELKKISLEDTRTSDLCNRDYVFSIVWDSDSQTYILKEHISITHLKENELYYMNSRKFFIKDDSDIIFCEFFIQSDDPLINIFESEIHTLFEKFGDYKKVFEYLSL